MHDLWGLYVGGWLLGLISWMCGVGDQVTVDRRPYFTFILMTFGWPLLLPLSFLALSLRCSYTWLRLNLWICQRAGAQVTFRNGPLQHWQPPTIPSPAGEAGR